MDVEKGEEPAGAPGQRVKGADPPLLGRLNGRVFSRWKEADHIRTARQMVTRSRKGRIDDDQDDF